MPHTLRWDVGVLLPPSTVGVFFSRDWVRSGERQAGGVPCTLQAGEQGRGVRHLLGLLTLPFCPCGSIREEPGLASIPTVV